jgi:hypothetical protein
MIDKLKRFIKYEEDAMSEDDPKGTCAASHRGEIRAYNRVIKWILEEEDSDKLAPCGHLERFWKVEPNQDAWCLQCAIDAQAAEIAKKDAEIERLNAALDKIANAEYPASDYQHPFGMLVRIEHVKAITDIAAREKREVEG